jgi:ankyrin repeat protein
MQDNYIEDLFAAAVRAGASVTAVDLHGNTPLHYLAHVPKFSSRLANVLVDAGAKIDCVNARGETPLMCALAAPREGAAMFVSSLLSLGAPIDSRSVDNGYTVCHFAAELRDRELMSTLIDTYRCDVNATSNNGKTPLMIACANGAWDVVTLLLAAGAKPHATALLEAVTAARTDIAETLIAAGVDVCVGDQHGWTACHYAVAQDNAELLNRLIAAGASVNVGGESLIHLAAIASLDGTMLQRLVAAGADVNAIDESGQTACHVAAVNKSITLRVLIDAGARFDTVDKNGCTALTKAVARGSRECVALLLAAGANATRVDQLRTDAIACVAVWSSLRSVAGPCACSAWRRRQCARQQRLVCCRSCRKARRRGRLLVCAVCDWCGGDGCVRVDAIGAGARARRRGVHRAPIDALACAAAGRDHSIRMCVGERRCAVSSVVVDCNKGQAFPSRSKVIQLVENASL